MFSLIKNFIAYIHSEKGWIAFAFAVIMCIKTLGFHLIPADQASYVALIVAALMCLRHGLGIDMLSAAFLLFIPFSIILANPDPVFRPWLRFALFAILYIVVSPLFRTVWACKFRAQTLYFTLMCCILISSVSFVCYFWGINMMRNTYDGSMLNYLVNTAGTFGGITSQSMLLGPISGVATIACAYLAMNTDRRFWILATMCGGSVLFAASRSSLLATIVGMMVLFFFSSASVGKNTKNVLLVCTLLLVTNPLWNGAMKGLTSKNKGSIYSSINTDSRRSKWSLRIEEWEESPIYGVGFCAVSKKDRVGSRGMIEPGSSWLAVLSMTGTVGFVLFSLIFYRAARNCLRYREPKGALAGGVLVMLGVHMFAEGHVFSGGSYLCFLVWLSLGYATDYFPESIPEEE